MEVIKEFLSNEFKYDNTKNQKNILELKIEKNIFKIEFDKIINTHYSLGNISKDEIEIIKDKLKIGMFYNSPCGGFINFYKIMNKKSEYILYSGVNEVSNSHYVVTLHKIIKC